MAFLRQFWRTLYVSSGTDIDEDDVESRLKIETDVIYPTKKNN